MKQTYAEIKVMYVSLNEFTNINFTAVQTSTPLEFDILLGMPHELIEYFRRVYALDFNTHRLQRLDDRIG